MNIDALTRREFLKLCSASCLAFGVPLTPEMARFQHREAPIAVGRVTTSLIYVYQEPFYNSERVDKRFRDQLLNLLEEIQAPKGPQYNPRWYRIDGGYVHSAYIQRVDFRPPNAPLSAVPEKGILGEVTVPFTRTFYKDRSLGWKPLYRLYYESIHWIKGVIESADGMVWYRITDPKNDGVYYVPAEDVRPILPEEYAPTARGVPADEKRIVVSIEDQTLTAYEGDKVVLSTRIASGLHTVEPKEGEIGTDTPVGFWRVSQKMPSRHMGNGHFTDEIDAYELPGVPWTIAFHDSGAALHGSFWHDNFGHRMSHGCVNMRNADALWLFRWTDPVYSPDDWYVNGMGTLIQIY